MRKAAEKVSRKAAPAAALKASLKAIEKAALEALRKNRLNGSVFYGCTNYGKEDGGCSYTVNPGPYEKMKAELLRRAEKETAEAKRLRKLEEEKKRQEKLAAVVEDDEVPF